MTRPRLIQLRMRESQDGCFGLLLDPRLLKIVCRVGELRWRANRRDISCIPAGRIYEVVPHESPRFGKCFLVKDVEGRDHILWHAANFAGDRSAGKRCDLLGCVAPGTRFGKLGGQEAVIASRSALSRLMRAYPDGFRVQIVDAVARRKGEGEA